MKSIFNQIDQHAPKKRMEQQFICAYLNQTEVLKCSGSLQNQSCSAEKGYTEGYTAPSRAVQRTSCCEINGSSGKNNGHCRLRIRKLFWHGSTALQANGSRLSQTAYRIYKARSAPPFGVTYPQSTIQLTLLPEESCRSARMPIVVDRPQLVATSLVLLAKTTKMEHRDQHWNQNGAMLCGFKRPRNFG